MASTGIIPRRSKLEYTERFSKERLDAFRRMGDPAADAVAAELHEKHGGLTNIHDLLTTVQAKSELGGEEGAPFRAFLEGTEQVPAWAEPKKIARGQRLHAVTYPAQGLSLFAGSLVGGAQFSTASVVTALAGNITSDPTRRINETGLLLAALAFPGTLLRPGGAANDSLTRVRLLHAALRHWLPRSGRLEPHRKLVPAEVYVEGEVPLCQQDLAITLSVFCYINLRSLRRMGVLLSAADIDAYTHMWRYAGHVLGIDEALLPECIADQEEFMLASMLHQGAPDNIPGDATKSFVDAFAQEADDHTNGWLPFSMTQTFLYQMIVYLNGADYTTGMEIPDKGSWHWSVLLVRSAGLFSTLVRYLPFGESALFHMHTRIIKRQLADRGTPIGHAAGSGADFVTKVSPPPRTPEETQGVRSRL